jgi:O-methyltransferase involved in polyketide biosynthesis
MRDYSSISPSAKGLLLMKGLTDIPFVADAAKIILGRPASTAVGKDKMDETFLKRLIHFEARYKSLDNLLENLGGNNILEMSSGFSFRGLQMAINNPDVTYIDTDLPGVIETKNELIDQLVSEQSLNLQGELLVMPLNVLDEESFINTVAKLPAGPVNIVNEGLLMYLDTAEKIQLCRIIRKILSQRGGYWITADIYIKKDYAISKNDHFSRFLEAHKIEEKKFDSFGQAESFFAEQGLKLFRKADPAFKQLSSLKYIPQHALEELATQARKIGSIRESWALVVNGE